MQAEKNRLPCTCAPSRGKVLGLAGSGLGSVPGTSKGGELPAPEHEGHGGGQPGGGVQADDAAPDQPEADPGQRDEEQPELDRRGDLIQILTQMAAAMAEPAGRALYALTAEMALHRDRHPHAAETIIETLLEPRLDALTAALRRAAKRGEIRPGAITGLLAQAGPALVIHQQMRYGSPPSEAEITEIVDRVLLPALGAAGASR